MIWTGAGATLGAKLPPVGKPANPVEMRSAITWLRKTKRALAIIASLIETAKLNGVDPEAYLASVLSNLAGRNPVRRIDKLLPWPPTLPTPSSPPCPDNSAYTAANREVKTPVTEGLADGD